MSYLRWFATLSGSALPTHAHGIIDMVVQQFGSTWQLFTGNMVDGGYNRLSIAGNGQLSLLQSRTAGGESKTMALSDIALIELGGNPHILAVGGHAAAPALRTVHPDTGEIQFLRFLQGTDEQLQHWTQATAVNMGGRDYLVVAQRGVDGLRVFEVTSSYALIERDRMFDAGKTALNQVTALETVTVGGNSFILATCAVDGGVTSLRFGAGGKLEVADVYGALVGAGIAGATAVGTVEVQGETFAVVAAAGTGTLTVLRVNHLGVMFETDHRWDNLETRFGGVQDVATFSHEGRSFVVAGGADDGLALFEVGPGGRLYHLESIAHQAGWTLENVRAIEAVVVNGQAMIFAAGETLPGLTQFRIDMARFGEVQLAQPGDTMLQGTARDDHLEAIDFDITLRGGDGDDRLVAGTGLTRMWGGPGEDVFVFRPGGGRDRIMDFEPGIDRIDLSAYDMLFSIHGIAIESTEWGARLTVQGDTIDVLSMDGSSLSAADLGNDAFIFA